MLSYDGFIKNVANSFDQVLSEIEAVHNFEFGSEFEVAICKTLRRVLPHRFGICRGYVVNRDGELAGDDIVIYDRIRFPTSRLLGEDFSRKEKVPIEAVFAYIEAKHTLQLEGKSDSSLTKALLQTANVKVLCDQRKPRALGQIAHNINLRTGFNVLNEPGWPDKRNPMYTMILARQVRMRDSEPVLLKADQIDAGLVGRSLAVYPLPDLIVAGRSNISIPVAKLEDGTLTILSPFSLKTGTDLTCFVVDGVAFGVALSHMLWALDYIELGTMPWIRILGDGLGLPIKQLDK